MSTTRRCVHWGCQRPASSTTPRRLIGGAGDDWCVRHSPPDATPIDPPKVATQRAS